MGLLRAMVQTGPPVLWAELQQEETWLSYARADLCALAAGDSAWPPVQVESWPKWVDMIRAAPDRLKLSVKKMLQQRHLAELEGYKTDLVLWALFRMAESADPQQTSSAPIWVCRMCRRLFASRGGVGAHFFKVHQRKATYRAVAAGSFCRGCGKEFWPVTRLSVHLQDTPRCVRALKAVGHRVDAPAPGLGSTQWRRLEEEQYTPAPDATGRGAVRRGDGPRLERPSQGGLPGVMRDVL